jgi:hypothetical protein
MKLSSTDTAQLKDLLSICALADIDSIIISDGTVRGANKEKTCAIISSVNVPKLSQKIGLSRISALRARMDLFSAKDAVIDAKETDRGEISQLEISAGKNKVQFRCTSTALIKAPLNINDRHDFSIFMMKDEVKMILDGIRVMGAKKIILSLTKNGVNIKISDESNDALNVQLETPASVEHEDVEDESIMVTYSTAIFPAILKAAAQNMDLVTISICQRGTAMIQVAGQNLALLPDFTNEDN